MSQTEAPRPIPRCQPAPWTLHALRDGYGAYQDTAAEEHVRHGHTDPRLDGTVFAPTKRERP